MESLRSLLNQLVIAEEFNTDYNKEFTREFAVSETVRVKLPQRFLIRDGIGYSPQPINRIYTTVACDQIFGVDFEWDSVEAALKAERGMELIKAEYIDKAMEQIAQEIDSRAALWARNNTNNVVGILGTAPTNMDISQAARQRLIENACPPGPRRMIVSPATMSGIVNGTRTTFNPQDEIAMAFKEGYYGRAAGFDWFESMSLYSQTSGVRAGAVTINGGGQSGSNILINATAGDTFFQGEKFNIDLVYNANPKTRRSTGVFKQFVITQDYVALGTAADNLNISPGITGPGSQYQNVDSLPADTAALTFWPGTTAPSTGPKSGVVGFALHRDAFAMVGVKLETPKAVEISSQTRDPKTGISVRFVRMFDPQQSKMINRFDVLLGFGNLYADQCAVAIASS